MSQSGLDATFYRNYYLTKPVEKKSIKTYSLELSTLHKKSNSFLYRNTQIKLKKKIRRDMNILNNCPGAQYTEKYLILRNQLCAVILAKLWIQIWMKNLLKRKKLLGNNTENKNINIEI